MSFVHPPPAAGPRSTSVPFDAWHRCALLGVLCTLGTALPVRALACASCGCTLSADAALGYSSHAGLHALLEYDYIDQDQLRSGTRAVSGVPAGAELEHDTLNRYISAGLSWAPNSAWNFGLQVPWVVRAHTTYGSYDPTAPLPPLSGARESSLGDLKLIGSWQGLLATRNLGFQLGIKLPTGRYGQDVRFSSGPAASTPLDASLQPGTGSTDVILGAYYFRAISQDFDVYGNVQFQGAVSHRLDRPGEDFRPGNAWLASAGLRYVTWPAFMPQLQVNLLRKAPDQGALADIQNSAGTVAYVSPGATVHLAGPLSAFAFVQVPAYRNLYGFQLFPRYTVSAGISYAP